MKLTLAQIMSNESPKNAHETRRGLHKANDTLTIVLPPGSVLLGCGLTPEWVEAATEIVTENGTILKPVS